MVTVFDRDRLADYQGMAASCAMPASAPSFISAIRRTRGQQFKYADKRNAPCAVIQGGDEKAKGEVQIKDLILGARARSDKQGPRRSPAEAGAGAIRGAGSRLVEAVRNVLKRHKHT